MIVFPGSHRPEKRSRTSKHSRGEKEQLRGAITYRRNRLRQRRRWARIQSAADLPTIDRLFVLRSSCCSSRASSFPSMFAETAGALRAVGCCFTRPQEQTGTGEKRHQCSPPADDGEAHGWEPLRGRSREVKRSETVMQRRSEHASSRKQQPASDGDVVLQHQQHDGGRQRQHGSMLHVNEEHEGGRPHPAVLKTGPDRRGEGPAARLCRRGERAGREVSKVSSNSNRWAALQVSLLHSCCLASLASVGPHNILGTCHRVN